MIARQLALVALLVIAASAAAQSDRRAGHHEIYLGPVFTDGKSYSFEGDAKATTSTGYGINFGYAYNLSSHFSVGFDLVWGEQDYRATAQPGSSNLLGARNFNGTIETSTFRLNGTWNIINAPFTPFLSGGMGWTYIDTNIPTGQLEGFCWYYPYWGQYCGTYVQTHTTTRFSYNAAAGLRLDFGKGVLRGLVNSQWVDWGGSYGHNSLIQYRIEIGTKF